MKRIFTFILIVFSLGFINLQGQTNLPNANFEQWSSSTNATNWSTDLSGSVTLSGFPLPLNFHFGTRTPDAHSGNYAMKIQGSNLSILTYEYVLPGICQIGTTGTVNLDLTDLQSLLQLDFENLDLSTLQTLASLTNLVSKGIPFNEIPTKLKAYVKFFPDPESNDSLSIYCFTTKWNTQTQSREYVSLGGMTSGMINPYSQVTLYMDTLNPNLTPDSISVIVFSGGINSSLATELYIDDITLEYTPNPVNIKDNQITEFSIYPNPASHFVTVTPFSKLHPYSIELFDMNGKSVLYKENLIQEQNIEVDFLSQGFYLMKIIQDNGISVKKIVIE